MKYRKVCLILCLITGVTSENSETSNCEEPKTYNNEIESSPSEEYRGGLSITAEEIEEKFKACPDKLQQIYALERKLAREGRIVKSSGRKADTSLNRNKVWDPTVRTMEESELPFRIVSDDLYRKHSLSKKNMAEDLPQLTLNGEQTNASRDDCMSQQPQPQCDRNSVYRTADGSCNNLNNPRWGMAMTCQERILRPSYTGQSGFRTSVNGESLPAPRTLSLNLHYDRNIPTNYVTHMYMFFGQLLDHDMVLTPISTTVDNEAIECCPPENETHPQCAPIRMSRNDPFYSQYGITCMNFVRSAICPTCQLGCNQVSNALTAFIDASFVYGNSEDETRSLRTNDGTGRLRSTQSTVGPLLPQSPDPDNDQCSFPETNDICFQAGDPRANQHTVLASLHTIFMREHNRIADGLRAINPRWDDERLFQETRRIVGAQMQVITYKEYLPITLNRDRMSYFHLWMSNRGTTSYDSRKNPAMMLEFTTAAFRFGHSLINGPVANRPRNATNGIRLLRNEFFQPFELNNGIIGPLMNGVSNSPAQWFDRHLVPDVTNFLYRIRGNATGLDLAAININRGRDHGMPPYVEMVRFCSEGEIEINSFEDLCSKKLMKDEQVRALRENYRDVRDVDLWPGILLENPSDGSVVGPTAACIIGMQFNHLKYGDRFYFEHGNQAGSFTYQQLQELRQASLSQIICLNTDVSELPRNAMLFNSRNNPMIQCRYVTGVDLSYWRE